MALQVAQRLSRFAASHPKFAGAARFVSPILTTGASALSYHLLTGSPTVTGLVLSALTGGAAGFLGVHETFVRMRLAEANAKTSLPPQVLEGRRVLERLQGEERLIKMEIAATEEQMQHAATSQRIALQPKLQSLESQLTSKALNIVEIERQLVTAGELTPVMDLGGGAMGKVAVYYSTGLGKAVVIKKVLLGHKLSPAEAVHFKGRFEQEAKSQGVVIHPYVARVYAFCDVEGEPALITEFIEGRDLSVLLRAMRARGKGLPPKEAAAYAWKIALGLKAAHDKGVIHRDIKPGNVILEAKTGALKLIDFGLARETEDDTKKTDDLNDDGRLTVVTTTFGTPEYMPPEQFSGARYAGKPSDVYSLGALLYELLTTRIPHEEFCTPPDASEQLSPREAAIRIGMQYMQSRSTKPPAKIIFLKENDPLQVLLGRMLAAQANARPEIGTVITELEDILRGM